MGGENGEFEVADFPRLGKRMVKSREKFEVYDVSDAKPFGPLAIRAVWFEWKWSTGQGMTTELLVSNGFLLDKLFKRGTMTMRKLGIVRGCR
jgi:hypothetical protein